MFVISFLRIISILLAIIGVSYVIPIVIALCYGEYSVILSFVIPMLASFLFLLVINLPLRRKKIELKTKTAFITVAGCWIFASLFGALPLFFSGAIPSFTDACFESVSGFTTTGSTILSEIESLPRSINMWRCETHWLGGMGIVTLTVAILPLLGVGGFQLIKAETTGPEKGKVTARITTTAKVLWIIYFALTLLETILLKIAGMDWTDALMHAFSTLGTGGFSSRNSSIGSYNSIAIDIIISVFMFLAGINFSLFYYIIVGKFADVKNNSEFKAYVGIVLIFSILLAFFIMPVYHNFGTSMRYSVFQVLSIITTSGYSTADFLTWPTTAQFLLFVLFFIGGCSGSTGGGIKVIRWVILFKQVGNETKRMLHPHGVFTVRLNGRVGRKDIVFNVAAFVTIYIILIGLVTLCGCFAKLDLFSAFTGAMTMVGNIGPAFGQLGPSSNFGFLPAFLKWIYCFAMLAGRLELYTMIIFFMPSYWKK
ncbi:MAG: TrkH family potassium uptake protein [Treponema sp.]|nr:TrkH family potassium uptake protein [Treponema sp.]